MRRRGKMFWFLVELDRWINASTGGSYPETLSYRWAGKRHTGCILCLWACRMLNFLDPGHCDRSKEHYDGPGRIDKDAF